MTLWYCGAYTKSTNDDDMSTRALGGKGVGRTLGVDVCTLLVFPRHRPFLAEPLVAWMV